MDDVGPIVIGMLALTGGLVFKAFLNLDDIRPEAPPDRRSKALFQQFYLAPDLILLAIGLLISSRGIEALLRGKGIPTGFGQSFPFWFGTLLWTYLILLGVSVLLWYLAGPRKYVPIRTVNTPCTLPDGTKSREDVPTACWGDALTSRAGIQTLLLGNGLGLAAVAVYVWFVQEAF